MENDDSELIQNFMERRPGALDELYRRYASVFFSVARYVLHSADDAQDCVHDALLRIWERRDSYRPQRGSLRAFLITCVRNEALTRRRTAARRRAIDESLAAVEPIVEHENEIIDRLEAARVRRALEALPADQKRALELAYFGGLTHREVALALGEPLGTIKSRLAFGVRRLGRELRTVESA